MPTNAMAMRQQIINRNPQFSANCPVKKLSLITVKKMTRAIKPKQVALELEFEALLGVDPDLDVPPIFLRE